MDAVVSPRPAPGLLDKTILLPTGASSDLWRDNEAVDKKHLQKAYYYMRSQLLRYVKGRKK